MFWSAKYDSLPRPEAWGVSYVGRGLPSNKTEFIYTIEFALVIIVVLWLALDLMTRKRA